MDSEHISEEREMSYHSEVLPFLQQDFNPSKFREIVERHQGVVSQSFSAEVLSPTTPEDNLRYLHGKLKRSYGLDN